eukprot:maker-scaffold_6-snap-gene-12.0-mRNA-1 protein AED:0.07 eAED:0.07 QI:0/0.5/0.33/1/0.5/0.33/3/78/902
MQNLPEKNSSVDSKNPPEETNGIDREIDSGNEAESDESVTGEELVCTPREAVEKNLTDEDKISSSDSNKSSGSTADSEYEDSTPSESSETKTTNVANNVPNGKREKRKRPRRTRGVDKRPKAKIDRNVVMDRLKSELKMVEESPNKVYCRFNELLGEGSFKKVYLGYDTQRGMEVAWNSIQMSNAIKGAAKLRLKQELKILQTLEHKSIMKFYCSWFKSDTKTLVKVINRELPLGFSRIKADAPVRAFIAKCLAAKEERPTARALLNDTFLQREPEEVENVVTTEFLLLKDKFGNTDGQLTHADSNQSLERLRKVGKDVDLKKDMTVARKKKKNKDRSLSSDVPEPNTSSRKVVFAPKANTEIEEKQAQLNAEEADLKEANSKQLKEIIPIGKKVMVLVDGLWMDAEINGYNLQKAELKSFDNLESESLTFDIMLHDGDYDDFKPGYIKIPETGQILSDFVQAKLKSADSLEEVEEKVSDQQKDLTVTAVAKNSNALSAPKENAESQRATSASDKTKSWAISFDEKENDALRVYLDMRSEDLNASLDFDVDTSEKKFAASQALIKHFSLTSQEVQDLEDIVNGQKLEFAKKEPGKKFKYKIFKEYSGKEVEVSKTSPQTVTAQDGAEPQVGSKTKEIHEQRESENETSIEPTMFLETVSAPPPDAGVVVNSQFEEKSPQINEGTQPGGANSPPIMGIIGDETSKSFKSNSVAVAASFDGYLGKLLLEIEEKKAFGLDLNEVGGLHKPDLLGRLATWNEKIRNIMSALQDVSTIPTSNGKITHEAKPVFSQSANSLLAQVTSKNSRSLNTYESDSGLNGVSVDEAVTYDASSIKRSNTIDVNMGRTNKVHAGLVSTTDCNKGTENSGDYKISQDLDLLNQLDAFEKTNLGTIEEKKNIPDFNM